MEQSGCKRRQLPANATTAKLAQLLANSCRHLPPVATTSAWLRRGSTVGILRELHRSPSRACRSTSTQRPQHAQARAHPEGRRRARGCRSRDVRNDRRSRCSCCRSPIAAIEINIGPYTGPSRGARVTPAGWARTMSFESRTGPIPEHDRSTPEIEGDAKWLNGRRRSAPSI